LNPATTVTCAAGDNPCAPVTCDPADGKCKPAVVADATPCDIDLSPCTSEQCKAGTCTVEGNRCLCAAGAKCEDLDDGNPCNGVLYCNQTTNPPACQPNPASVVQCPPGDGAACVAPACDPADGKCKTTAVKDGLACSDGDPCTVLTVCHEGACTGALAKCEDGDGCTLDSCDAATGACSKTTKADGAPCFGGQCGQGKCKVDALSHRLDVGESTVSYIDPLGRVLHWGMCSGCKGVPTQVGAPRNVAPWRDVDLPYAVAMRSAFAGHRCAVGVNGKVYCDRADDKGFQVMPDLAAVQWLESSRQAFIAVDGAGKAWEWPVQGSGAYQPKVVVTTKSYRQAAVGFKNYCGLDAAGALHCWGAANKLGLLGSGAKDDSAPSESPVNTLTGQVAGLCGNSNHVCARMADGSARCWGHNGAGVLGDGTETHRYVPTPVKGLTGARSLSCGFSNTCALLDDDTARCWGSNLFGEVGNGALGHQLEPAAVKGLSNLIGVDSHFRVGCAMKADHSVFCWGRMGSGRLCQGVAASDPTVPRAHAQPYISLCDAYGVMGCAIDSDGKVWTWGSNEQFGLSAWPSKANLWTAQKLPGSFTASKGSIAYRSGCAITSDGLYCWGDNEYGKVTGKAPYGKVGQATLLANSKGAKAVHTSIFHTCYIAADGKVFCFGSQNDGMLGNGKTAAASLGPTPVQGLPGGLADDLAGGHTHTCALASGKSYCWGKAYGASASATPGGHTWQAIDGGFYQTCAIKKGTGEVYCWCLGSTDCNKKVPQAGISATPVKIPGLTKATAIASGPSPNQPANCAVVGNDVFCWGKEVVKVHTFDKPVELNVFDNGYCALESAGKLWCWGTSFEAIHGTGAGVRYQPVQIPLP